jgi:hypothetical protein
VFGPSARSRPTRGGSVDPNELMNERFSHYDRRAPSRDRSRDSSVDRFSRSSRYSSRQNLQGSTPGTADAFRSGPPNFTRPGGPVLQHQQGMMTGDPRHHHGGHAADGMNVFTNLGMSMSVNQPLGNPGPRPGQAGRASSPFGTESHLDSPVINLDPSLGYSLPSERSDMVPSPTPSGGPKRTESLYITPVAKPKEPSAVSIVTIHHPVTSDVTQLTRSVQLFRVSLSTVLCLHVATTANAVAIQCLRLWQVPVVIVTYQRPRSARS